jgi:antitoxin HicB
MKTVFPAHIEPDESGRYFVRFLDLAEALTEGETLEEALFNAREVLTLTLEARLAEGMDLPIPGESTGENVHGITPAARVQAAYLVHRNRGDRSLADLARALETSWPAVKRLEDPHHSPTLKMLERTAASLGKKLVLSFE